MQFEATHHRSPGSSTRLRTDARRSVLTDEAVSFRFTLSTLESRVITAVVLQELKATGWQNGDTIFFILGISNDENK